MAKRVKKRRRKTRKKSYRRPEESEEDEEELPLCHVLWRVGADSDVDEVGLFSLLNRRKLVRE